MNRLTLLTLYRSLTRQPLYAALNIGGLAVGIAVLLVLGLYVRFETGFERWLPHSDQIYIVRSHWHLPGVPDTPDFGTMGGLLEELKGDLPETDGTRILGSGATVLRSGEATPEQVQLVDPNFFHVIGVPVVEGNGPASVADPTAVLISQSMAKKYLPGVDPLGKRLTLSFAGAARDYHIAGVLKDAPPNTDLKWDFVMRLVPSQLNDQFWSHWGSERLQTFLRFPNREAAKAYEARMPAFIRRHGAGRDLGPDANKVLNFAIEPFTSVHLSSPSDRLTVTTLGLVGLLVLLIAIVNYVNLATARAGLRAREVAMRKVLGGSRSALIRQFLGEAVATAAIAALIALALAELALPLVNSAGGLKLSIPYEQVVPALVLLVLLVGVAAGLYPAVMLSRFPAAQVLASARTPGGGRSGARLREVLVVFQFALAIAFMIGTGVLFAQIRHVRNTDLGFSRDGLILITSFNDANLTDNQRHALLAGFRSMPGVRSVTTSDAAPGDESLTNQTSVGRRGVPVPQQPFLRMVETGADWFATYGPHFIAGRPLDQKHRQDDASPKASGFSANIILNASATKALGFSSPQAAVGQTVVQGPSSFPATVVGVIDDMRFFSPRAKLPPTVYRYWSSDFPGPLAALRTNGGDPKAMIGRVQAIWRQVAPQVPFEAKTAEQSMQHYYDSDNHAARLFSIGAILAVLIGCVGLWGLASFNTQRRVKEIGIRKTLGASSRDIVRLLIGQFLRPVIIANLIAWPLAYVAMRHWLAGFDDRITLSPLFFLGGTFLALAIAVGTVLAQSLRAARAEPAWALRHE